MSLLQATAANHLFPLAGTNTSKNNKSGTRTMDPFVLINCLRVATTRSLGWADIRLCQGERS